MSNYHINEKTGRPNLCSATKRACPVGGEHYPSKEVALAAVEKTAASENSTFSKLKKTPVRTAPKYPSVEENFKKLMPLNLDEIPPARFKSNIVELIKESADYENPGCGGCDGSETDYCRCKRYTGGVSLSPREMAIEFFNNYAADNKYRWDYERLPDDEKEVVSRIEELLNETGVSDLHKYEVEAGSDYYGESIERIIVEDPERFNALHERLEEIYK